MLEAKNVAEIYTEHNEANASFWDEMCGTQLARSLGINDHSPASLKRFDDWYFAFYPYLDKHIPFADMRNSDVLEVGLGYGTVAQRIAEGGARYQGLDVAEGPVALVNHRLQSNGFAGSARRASILSAPFADAVFDFVVAIGCFHHTGDIRRAVEESYRMLRPGGRLIFMVYYAYSYRRWMFEPLSTLAALGRERFAWDWQPRQGAREREAYDVNSAGQAAPITEFLSRGRLAEICSGFSRVEMVLENAAAEGLFKYCSRNNLIRSRLASRAGLDIYVSAWK